MTTQPILVQLNALKQCIRMYEARDWNVSSDLKAYVEGLTLTDYMRIHDNINGRRFDGITRSDGIPVILLFAIPEDGKEKTMAMIYSAISDRITEPAENEHILFANHVTVVFLDDIKKTDFDKFSEDQGEYVKIPAIQATSTTSAKPSKILWKSYGIEFFNVKHASLDILGHKYQPKFTLYRLSGQSDKAYEKYGKICIDDPISKYFYAQPNDVFKIERNSHTGASITYRIVKNIKMNNIIVKNAITNESGVDENVDIDVSTTI